MKTLTKLALAIKEARYMKKAKLVLTESRCKSALSDACRLILFAFGIAFLGIVNAANATCPDGAERPCTINGKHGRQVCAHSGWSPCVPDEPPETAISGQVHPKYYVLTVVYAPPGTNGGLSSSSVTYGSGSTMGTTVAASNSFKESFSTSISTGGGILGSAEIGVSFGYGLSTSDSQSLDIKKSTSSEKSYSGPSSDGIDHDHDLIYLWLNPTIELQLTPTSAAWNLGNNPQPDVQYVYVGWLKDPSKMQHDAPGVVQRLQSYGITPEDYPQMLKADPFAYGTPTVDDKRFQFVFTTFPYEPPYAPGDPVPIDKGGLAYSSTGTRSTTVQNEYTVGVSISGSVNFAELFKASVKTENKWTWTSTDTRSTSTSTSESASVAVGGPAYGYSGPSTDIAVYYDVIYKTFLFTWVETTLQPSLYGSVKTPSGKVVSGKEVDLVANGIKHRTFTNTKGEYRIFGTISGPLQLQVDGTKKQLLQVPRDKKADIVLSIAKDESGSRQ